MFFHMGDNPPGTSFGCAALHTAGRSRRVRGTLGLAEAQRSEVLGVLIGFCRTLGDYQNIAKGQKNLAIY